MGGVERMGSTTLRLWRLAVYLAFTLLLMPVQAIGLVLGQRWVATFPRFYHRCCCRILGLRVRRIGRPTTARPVLFAANHISYLDIIVFSSLIAGSFIAKREVAGWPLFGQLAKLQRSVFIDRQVRSTMHQRDSIAGRLAAGDHGAVHRRCRLYREDGKSRSVASHDLHVALLRCAFGGAIKAPSTSS